MILLIISLTAAVVGAYGPMLSPGFVQVSAELGITVDVLAQATAWVILAIGLGLFVSNPLGKVLGRRPVYLGSVAIMFAASVWGAAVSDYPGFLASRIVAGLAMAPFEVLTQCTIGDMYFVHERATRLAIWQLFLLTGISGGAMIAGPIIQYQGYRWTFGACAVCFGVLMLAIFFLVPETCYPRRAGVAPLDEGGLVVAASSSPGAAIGDDAEKVGEEKAGVEGVESVAPLEDRRAIVEEKHSYLRSLRVFTGRYSSAPLWRIFSRPVVLFFYPAVLWAFMIYGKSLLNAQVKRSTEKIGACSDLPANRNPDAGTTMTWIVVFSVVNAVIFNGPPYNFTVSQTGLVSLSPFIMTIIGELVAGPLNDWLCMYLARRNKGIYEPEFRLPTMAIAVVLGTVGFFGFGASIHYQTHWLGPVLCFGFANMSMCFAATCVFGYIVDSYRTLNEEAMVSINARNLLTFGLTYFVNGWLAERGPLEVFCILGGLFLIATFLTIPMW